MKRRLGSGVPDVPLIHDDYGVLRSVSHLTAEQRLLIACRQNYLSRAAIALDVASHYPGGDYFEFGSHGLCTFCSFLAAFQIFSLGKHHPDTHFYAFDIFGNPDSGSGPPAGAGDYFEHWRASSEAAAPLDKLATYRELKDRCVLVPGYFEDTLNAALKAKMRAARQRIGFAFLDVNTPASYKLVFDFLIDVMVADKMFIYLDEYFTDPPVPPLYEAFCDQVRERYGLRSIYMRNAANFGALFCLMPPPAVDYHYLFAGNPALSP
ncbi:MAG TPA: hypothetical protein VGL83_16795 [Stellaceae bacterium]